MKLPIPFLKSKKGSDDYYLVLLLTDDKAESVILKKNLNESEIVSRHQEKLLTPLENLTIDELVQTIDKTISRAEEILPPDIQTHKTVFGVKDNWIDNESKKIKKEYLHKLKKASDALSLTPVGFLVISEAVAHMLQADEGSPLSAVLAEVGKREVKLTLYRGGKIVETARGGLEENAATTTDTLLKEFTTAVLPARVILYSNKEHKNLGHEFTKHQWSKSLPFLHVPQVNALAYDFDIKAVTFGASEQMGLTVSNLSEKIPDISTSIEPEDELKNPDGELKTNDISEGGGNFGFVLGKDVAKDGVGVIPQHEKKEDDIIPAKKDDDSMPLMNLHGPKRESDKSSFEYDDDEEEPTNDESKIGFKNMVENSLAFLGSIKPSGVFEKITNLREKKGLLMPILAIIGILIVFVGFTLFYYFNTKAEVVLSVKPEIVETSEKVIFSTASGTNFSENIIAGKSVTVAIDGELEVNTTGKKDVGEKAKGKVTVYNNSDDDISISSGTRLTSSNDLVFVTQNDIEIDAATGDVFSGTKPGTKDVDVVAEEIGTDSNLPSGTRFTIGNNSDLAARNGSAFSNGTKKTVTVVSADDIKKLRTDLPKSLSEKAVEELSKKIGGDEKILPVIINSSLEKEKFDKEEDDETGKVKLTATVVFEEIAYNQSELTDFSKAILKKEYSDDISFADNKFETRITEPEAGEDGEVAAALDINAGLLPKIDTTEIVKKIKGRSAKEIKNMLTSLPQVEKAEIKYTPNLLFLTSLFPTLPNNINVSLFAQE